MEERLHHFELHSKYFIVDNIGRIKILRTQGWEKLGGGDFFSFKRGRRGGLTLDDTMH